ncbi:MAG: hypothetical protein K0R84_2043 [Clostridia bacterium]|nr:hypothetical protein [Clostridia bacterium]
MKRRLYLISLLVLALLCFTACSPSKARNIAKIEAEKVNNSQNDYHPVAFTVKNWGSEEFSELIVLGGSSEDKWYRVTEFNIEIDGKSYSKQDFLENDKLNGSEVDIDLVKGGESFKLYSGSKMVSEAKSDKKPSLYVSQASAQESLMLDITPFEAEPGFLIGVSGDWEVQPRPLKVIEENKQYSVDMDGDGKEEIIQLKEKASEEMLELYLIHGSYDTLIQEIAYVKAEDVNVLTLDLNGDGSLELITQHGGPAGWIGVFELIGDSVSQALSFDSGE